MIHTVSVYLSTHPPPTNPPQPTDPSRAALFYPATITAMATQQNIHIDHEARNEEVEAAAEAAADYWDTSRLGDLTDAARNAAAELGVEEQYYAHEQNLLAGVGTALPVMEIPRERGIKPKSMSAHDLKWNKNIEGIAAVLCHFFCTTKRNTY